MDEKKISEKNFKGIDKLMIEVDDKITDGLLNEANTFYESGKRLELFYELTYDKIYKQIRQ
jgi:hypothetical protein